MNKQLVIILILLSGFLTGCVSLADVKKSPPKFQGEVKGNYSYLARCMSKSMQDDSRWTINTLQYNVNVYPDNKTSEVLAYANGAYTGTIYAFELVLKQKNNQKVYAILKGNEYETGVAWQALQQCATQKPF